MTAPTTSSAQSATRPVPDGRGGAGGAGRTSEAKVGTVASSQRAKGTSAVRAAASASSPHSSFQYQTWSRGPGTSRRPSVRMKNSSWLAVASTL